MRSEGTVLAYDYPLLGLFWTMLWFFLWIAWLVALFQIIGDIFNSDDLGGWGKALWLIFVIILPLLGVLIYLIARGGGMQRRAIEKARARGLKTIGLLGGTGGIIREQCDVAVVVPSDNTQRIQEAHITLGHIICESVEQQLYGSNE